MGSVDHESSCAMGRVVGEFEEPGPNQDMSSLKKGITKVEM